VGVGQTVYLHTELFDNLAYHLPQELAATKEKLERRLAE
jgi:hypothetical protein